MSLKACAEHEVWISSLYHFQHHLFMSSQTHLSLLLLGSTCHCLPTPWNRVLLEKLTGLQLVKKFPEFYGTQSFITAFTSDHHLFLSWASSIQSTSPTSHFLKIHFNITLPSTPGSSKWSLSLRFSHQNPVYTSPLPHTCYMHRTSHSYRFDHQNNTRVGTLIVATIYLQLIQNRYMFRSFTVLHCS